MLAASRDRFKSIKSAFRILKRSEPQDGTLSGSAAQMEMTGTSCSPGGLDDKLDSSPSRDPSREPCSPEGEKFPSLSTSSTHRDHNSLSTLSSSFSELPGNSSVPTHNMIMNTQAEGASTGSGHTRRNSQSSIASVTTLGPENPLNILSQLEGGRGLDLLIQRASQINNSAKLLAEYLNRRAQAETHLASDLNKYLGSIVGNNPKDYKQGSYGIASAAYLSCANMTASMHDDFALKLRQLATDLEEKRKKTKSEIELWKERGRQHQKGLNDSMQDLEKAKARYEEAQEILESLLLQLDQEIANEVASSNVAFPTSSSGLLAPSREETLTRSKSLTFKPDKSLRKMCMDARVRADVALEVYKQQLSQTNTVRKLYYEKKLPRVLKFIMEHISLLDSALRYYLVASHRSFEDMLEAEVMHVQSEGGVGDCLCAIDNAKDFTDWAEMEAMKSHRYKDIEMELDLFQMRDDAVKVLHTRKVFGVSLKELVARTERSVPLVVQKCIACVEEFGLDSVGIYRVSGSTVQVKRLRELFDADSRAVNLKDIGVFQDVNNVTGVLKLFLRELPESLLTLEFTTIISKEPTDGLIPENVMIEACKALPTENYALLSFLIAHLKKVVENEHLNKMNAKNLSIVFGPTLVGGDENLLTAGYRAVEAMLRGSVFRECEV